MAFDKVIDSVQLDNDIKSVADAIRAKGGTTEQLIFPTGFNTAIENIEAGGGGAEVQEITITSNGTYNAPEGIGYSPVNVNVPQDGAPTAEELTVTGDCSYRFAGGGWNWVIKRYGNQITTKDINNAKQMFSSLRDTLTNIPFDLNFDKYSKTSISYIFQGTFLQTLPVFHNCKVEDMDDAFHSTYIKYFPEHFENGFDFSYIENQQSPYGGNQQDMFANMLCLRQLPYEFLKHGNPQVYYTNTYYDFDNDRVLDAIVDLPNPYYNGKYTNNIFAGFSPRHFVENCNHLKDLTFSSTMTNGEPNNPKWSNQTIDTSQSTGYGCYANLFILYGLPAEKEIKDDATYQQFKNDNDAWTTLQEYSRYNHDSAVRTINSLPDTSAFIASNGGTNTIKFAGANGSKTDGGAISTLTPEEIAVATAKGWTVTLV